MSPGRPPTARRAAHRGRERGLPRRRARVHRPVPASASSRWCWTAATAWPGRWWARCSTPSRSSRCRPTGRPTASSPTTSPTRCWRRTGSSSSTRCAARARTSASPGTATPTAASSSTTRGAFVDGDFLTALLGESLRAARSPAPPCSTTSAPRAPCGTSWRRAGGTALVNRVGHAFFKTPDARDRRGLRRRGLRPLLLPRLLLRRLGHPSGAADPRAARRDGQVASASCCSRCATATSSPGRSTRRWRTRTRRCARSRSATRRRGGMARRRVRGLRRLALQRPARPTPSRCCA